GELEETEAGVRGLVSLRLFDRGVRLAGRCVLGGRLGGVGVRVVAHRMRLRWWCGRPVLPGLMTLAGPPIGSIRYRNTEGNRASRMSHKWLPRPGGAGAAAWAGVGVANGVCGRGGACALRRGVRAPGWGRGRGRA